jgi:hypothetical protein
MNTVATDMQIMRFMAALVVIVCSLNIGCECTSHATTASSSSVAKETFGAVVVVHDNHLSAARIVTTDPHSTSHQQPITRDDDGDSGVALRGRQASEAESYEKYDGGDPPQESTAGADHRVSDNEQEEAYEKQGEGSTTPSSSSHDGNLRVAGTQHADQDVGLEESTPTSSPKDDNDEAEDKQESEDTDDDPSGDDVDEPVDEHVGFDLAENTEMAMLRHQSPPTERDAQADSIFPFRSDNIFGSPQGSKHEANETIGPPPTRLGTRKVSRATRTYASGSQIRNAWRILLVGGALVLIDPSCHGQDIVFLTCASSIPSFKRRNGTFPIT